MTRQPFRVAMENEDVTTPPAALTCKLCRRTLPAGASGRTKGKTWQCRTCLSLKTMLYRNLGSGALDEWTVSEKESFFKKAASTCPGGQYDWSTVRTCVVQTQTKSRVEEKGSSVVAEALPMGVWLKRGYEQAAVEAFEDTICPHLGQLYAVPVRSDVWREVRSQVDQEVLQREKDVCKAKRNKKRKAADEGGQGEEEEWDVAPCHPKPSSSGRAAPKARGKAKSEMTPNEQARRLEKENQKTDKANERKMANAVKALAALSPQAKALAAVQAQAAKLSLPVEPLSAAWKDTEEKKNQANAVVTAGHHVQAHVPLPDLPYSMEDLKNHVKATKTLLAETRKDIRAAKDAQAAAEEKPEK